MIHSITSKVWASSGSSFFIVSIALFAVFLISALSKIVVFSAFGAKLLTISIAPHPPLSVLLSKLLDRYRGIFIEVVNGHAEILCENLEFISFRLATTGFPIG